MSGRGSGEGYQVAAFVQGGLCMAAYQVAASLKPPVTVEQPVGEDGIYEPFFRMRLASGHVLRISVDVEGEAP